MSTKTNTSTVKAVTARSTQRCKNSKKTGTTKANTSQFVTREQVFGGKFIPSLNPPDVVFLPWNRVTLVIPFTGSYTVKVSTLRDVLKKQCDPTGRGFNPSTSGDRRFVPSFKVQTYQAWNLTGHLISMSVQDFTDTQSARGGRDQMAGIVDSGGPGILPKVGYKLPAGHRNHVLRSDDIESEIEILVTQVGSSDQGLLYISLEYRFDGTASLPQSSSLFSILSKCSRFVRQIDASSHVTSVKTEETANLAAQILSAMPPTSLPIVDAPTSPIYSIELMEQVAALSKRIEVLEMDVSSTSYDKCCSSDVGS